MFSHLFSDVKNYFHIILFNIVLEVGGAQGPPLSFWIVCDLMSLTSFVEISSVHEVTRLVKG